MDFSISHLSYIVGCEVAFLAILIFKAQVNDLKNVINSIYEAAFSKGSSVEGYIFEAENYSIPYQLLTLRKIISKESLVAAEFMLLGGTFETNSHKIICQVVQFWSTSAIDNVCL